MIESPRLDNRSFQDIVNEAKRLIPVHCPEWTDHNLSDPGVTLIELFAWMTDSIIYRINQVPERASAQLLKLIGVTPAPPRPATADLTFFLSAPAETPFVVPAGTEAATENTDQSDAIVFTTLGALTIPASAKPVRCESRTGDQVTDCSKLLRRPLRGDEPPVEIFQRIPAAGDALVLSFERDLSGLVLNLKLRCDSKRGTGIDPRNPPLKWEYLVEGKQEVTCYVYDDTTRGLNEAGDIRLMIPLQPRTENDTPANSQLRCVLQAPSGPATPRYDSSPAMRSITVEVIGGTTVAEHSALIEREGLGRSDGTRTQVWRLKFAPVLSRRGLDETLTVELDSKAADGKPNVEVQQWEEVPDFAGSSESSKHFTLDSQTGEIRFGPAMRAADGRERMYGEAPKRGVKLVFKRYRTGGGAKGRVGARTINFLRSSLPRVAGVTNFTPSSGGQDAESLDEMKLRALGVLRSHEAAITPADFQKLAVEALPGVVPRAHCVAPAEKKHTPRLVLVPRIPNLIDPPPEMTEDEKEKVKQYIEKRRLLGTEPSIETVNFWRLKVQVIVRLKEGSNLAEGRSKISRALVDYLHPLHGGPVGDGWPFGRDVTRSDLIARVQQVSIVDDVDSLRISESTNDEETPRVILPPGALPWVTQTSVEVEIV